MQIYPDGVTQEVRIQNPLQVACLKIKPNLIEFLLQKLKAFPMKGMQG